MTDTKTQIFHSDSEAHTADIAHRLAKVLTGGEYISLEGDLGAGKTLFSRELARAFGISQSVTSPTFVIQKLYPVPETSAKIAILAHYDFYRIHSYHELVEMGFEDHDSSTIVLAEWGNMFLNEFPVPPVRVRIFIEPEDQRTIVVENLTAQL